MNSLFTSLKTNIIILFVFILFYSAQTNSQTWNALGTGTSGKINAVTVFNGTLIAAGSFTTAGGVTVNNIAAWNGTAWAALGTGTDGVVYALTIFNNQLVAAGGFTTAGGVTCNKVARWNGTTWASLGLGANDTIYALSNYLNNLRAGGKFTTVGGVSANRVARWDGTNWFAMGNGVSSTVYALAANNTDLFLGGAFTNGGGFTGNRIVRYNGNYFQLGNGVDNGTVYALTFNGTTLYVGGAFSTIGGVTVNNIATWSGTNWNTVSSGTNGVIRALFANGTSTVMGGTFSTAGTTSARNIAVWSGSAFSALGAGIGDSTSTVNGITLWSNVLIAGGTFSTAGASAVSVNNIAGYGAVPAAPLLVSPADGATFQSQTPVLDWTDVAGATTYGVQVSANANFTTTVVNIGNLPTSTYTVPGGVLALNVTYFWRATASNGLGTSPFSLTRFFTTGLVGIINNQEVPLTFNLFQNYPNPFNPATKIKFDLPANSTNGAKLNFTIYDIEGKIVASLINQDYVPGKWEITFDASNYPSGVYFYKLTAGNYTAVNKMMLIK